MSYKLMRKHNYMRYQDSLNPYEKGTLRFERLKRYYVRDRKGFLETDSQFRELCDVYGTELPDKPWMNVEV